MGNYRQDGTAAGTGGKLLKAVTDSVVETFARVYSILSAQSNEAPNLW